ncbi:methionine import ATP-binding protein MetN [Asticcacaulis endophyticus]|uniref:Methionine import ATP-binding protein MetN n=2 Tax=Asticcacaulis endophyticus TaxID=1395890 RepID=A0A918Q4Z1_9CAUL|nr:methionine import ATP-binding protein MetN [Asticcacaulis endophyticus]
MINRLERPTQGRVEIDGVDLAGLDGAALSALRHKLGMIFQQFGLLSTKTALQNVAFALELAGTGTASSRKARALELLERVGLSAHADKYPAQLSGGQKQRVAIARALANNPNILLCDEATSALDPYATQDILSLLTDLNRDLGLTIVLVTHEMEVVRQVCDRVAILDQGRLAEVGAVADVLLDPQSPEAVALAAHLLPRPENVASSELVRLTWFGEDRLHATVSGLDVWVSLHAGQVSHLKSGLYGDVWATVSGPERLTALARLRDAGLKVGEVAS